VRGASGFAEGLRSQIAAKAPLLWWRAHAPERETPGLRGRERKAWKAGLAGLGLSLTPLGLNPRTQPVSSVDDLIFNSLVSSLCLVKIMD